MKKLSPEQQLINCKYQYPAYCTTYKNGVPTSYRVVTHNIGTTDELRKLQPSLVKYINTYK